MLRMFFFPSFLLLFFLLFIFFTSKLDGDQTDSWRASGSRHRTPSAFTGRRDSIQLDRDPFSAPKLIVGGRGRGWKAREKAEIEGSLSWPEASLSVMIVRVKRRGKTPLQPSPSTLYPHPCPIFRTNGKNKNDHRWRPKKRKKRRLKKRNWLKVIPQFRPIRLHFNVQRRKLRDILFFSSLRSAKYNCRRAAEKKYSFDLDGPKTII